MPHPSTPAAPLLPAWAASVALGVVAAAALLLYAGAPEVLLAVAPTPTSAATGAAASPRGAARLPPPITAVPRTVRGLPLRSGANIGPAALPTPAPGVSPIAVVGLLAPVAALTLVWRRLASRTSHTPRPFDVVAIAPLSGARVPSCLRRPPTALRATPSGGAGERYEVELEKPIGITLARGNDGATYVLKVPPGPRFEQFTPGDRVTKCSASFGPDIWEALNYGQVMFAIKTRNGNVFLELEKRGGDMSVFESNKSSRFQQERNSGNYGSGTMEMQMKNYAETKELERKREAMWREACEKVKAKKYEDALVLFENVIGLEPIKFIGDNFSLSTDLFRISHYQMACVYSLMGNVDASLESLREAMKAGFDDFKQVRTDPDLARTRESEEFEDLMSRFDESPFNTDAINALKGMFGGMFGGKK